MPTAEQLQSKNGYHARYARSFDWVTPRWIIDGLGPFDLDPCCCKKMPWRTARRMWTTRGLDRWWQGTVWCNPPYGNETWKWVERLARHGDGMALVAARTCTVGFHRWVFAEALAILFLRGRVFFHLPDGSRYDSSSGHASVIAAYGEGAARRLAHAVRSCSEGVAGFEKFRGTLCWPRKSSAFAFDVRES
jgi:uncharacterized cupin superfamily protein